MSLNKKSKPEMLDFKQIHMLETENSKPFMNFGIF